MQLELFLRRPHLDLGRPPGDHDGAGEAHLSSGPCHSLNTAEVIIAPPDLHPDLRPHTWP